jgi:hypothetical protein
VSALSSMSTLMRAIVAPSGVDRRARASDLRLCRSDRRHGGLHLRPAGDDGGLRAAHPRAVVIKFLRRRSAFAGQRFRTRQAPLRRVEFALALGNERQHRLAVAFALRDLRLRAGDRGDQLLLLRRRFVALRFEGLHLHVGQDLAGCHEVAIGDQNVLHTSAELG